MKEKKIINIQIGERIHISRENARITQEKLAECVGVSVQYISDLERGIVGTSVPTLIKICTALNVSSDYILFNQDKISFPSKDSNTIDMLEQIKHLPPAKQDIIIKGIQVILEAFSC